MLKLLQCARGHFWESADEPAPDRSLSCPECGAPADTLPLLDLAPGEITGELDPPIPPLELALLDDDGRPLIAGYEITEDLGRGPTGVRLYRARQVGLNRDVLLEVVLAKEDAGQNAWGSLRGEASALGKLLHPNILPIHDVGERDRQSFYNAVELIDGPTLPQKVADKPLPFRQAARLVELIARAVDHAHRRGVLHRNLRPASVLLQPVEMPKDSPERDDPSGAACQLHGSFYIPRLTGFGLVRRAVEGESIDADLFGEDLGHLSPEQAWGRAKDLGPTTDVYGLGGILYFLITGRPPFRGPTYTDTLDTIQTAELVPPSSVRSCPKALEEVCKKALSRQPRRRYGSAAELADDLRRARLGLPIRGRPVSAAQRLGNWIGRHPAAFFLSLLLLASAFVGMLAYFVGESEAEDARRREADARRELARARQEANRHGGVFRPAEIQQFLAHKHKIDRARHLLARNDKDGARAALNSVAEDQRGFEWHYLTARLAGTATIELTDFDADITATAFSADGERLATSQQGQKNMFGQARGHVRFWDLVEKKQLREWKNQFPGPVHALALNAAATRLAAAGGGLDDSTGELRVFDTQGGDVTANRTFLARLTDAAYLDHDRGLVVARGDGTLTLLTAEDNPRETLPSFGQPSRRFGRVTRLSAGPRDSGVAVCTAGLTESAIYNISTGGQTRSLNGHPDAQTIALGQSILHDGKTERRAAVARTDSCIIVQSLDGDHTDELKLADLGGTPTRLAFGNNATRLAAAFPDGTVRVWALTGQVWVEILTLAGPGDVGLAFGNDGKALASAGRRKVVVWGTID